MSSILHIGSSIQFEKQTSTNSFTYCPAQNVNTSFVIQQKTTIELINTRLQNEAKYMFKLHLKVFWLLLFNFTTYLQIFQPKIDEAFQKFLRCRNHIKTQMRLQNLFRNILLRNLLFVRKFDFISAYRAPPCDNHCTHVK